MQQTLKNELIAYIMRMKLKLISLLILFFVLPAQLQAKWLNLNANQQIKQSDLIVIASVEKCTEQKKPFYGFYTQKSVLRIKSILKGTATEKIFLFGSEKGICASSAVSVDIERMKETIFFLRSSQEGYVVTNGTNSICIIDNDSTKWFGKKTLVEKIIEEVKTGVK